MKYLPVRCDLHGWLLLDAETVSQGQDHVIECEGHMIAKNTLSTPLIEFDEFLPKTRGLNDAEMRALWERANKLSAERKTGGN